MKNSKSDKNQGLNSIFNISNDSIVPNIVENTEESLSEIDNLKSTINDIRDDYEYTRNNLYSLVKKGQDAINGALELAQETEMPRAYEVAGQLIKNVSDVTDKLMDLQKKLKDIEESSISKGPTNVTNALFVGSTAELAKLLKNKEKDDINK
jgi:hypothetical protein